MACCNIPLGPRCSPLLGDACAAKCSCNHIGGSNIVGGSIGQPLTSHIAVSWHPCPFDNEQPEWDGCSKAIACGPGCSEADCASQGVYGWCCATAPNGHQLCTGFISQTACLQDINSGGCIDWQGHNTRRWTSAGDNNGPPSGFCAACVTPPTTSCCGCDWCCDGLNGQECTAFREFSFENLPTPNSSPCLGTSCPTAPPRPVCRRAEFAVGKRPTQHDATCYTPDPPNRRGRHELFSLDRIRARDLGSGGRCSSPGGECNTGQQCRTYYGHVGRGADFTPTTRTVGWLCGQENRCNDGSKRANRCRIQKRPDGRHSFECAYRSPCPERPVPCL